MLSEEWYRIVVENSPDVLSHHDELGVCSFISRACETVLGYSPQQMLGRTWEDLIEPEDSSVFRLGREEALRTLRMITVQYRIRRQDQQIVWLETVMRAAPQSELCDALPAAGNPSPSAGVVSLVCSSRDI